MTLKEITISVGDYITVTNGPIYNNGDRKVEDQSYQGECLQVLCFDENLVQLRKLDKHEHARYMITLDLDKWKIRKLSDEFVNIIKKDIEDYENSESRDVMALRKKV